MRKVLNPFIAFAVAAFAMISCTKENPIQDSSEKLVTVTLSAGKPEFDNTKTEMSGTKVLWSKGDAIGVTPGNKAEGHNYKFTNDNASASETATFTGSTAVSNKLYAYAPYQSVGVAVKGAKVVIPALQKPTTTSFDGSADVLVSQPFSVDDATTNVDGLVFRRLTSVLKIVLKDKESTLTGSEVTNVSITSSDADIVGRAYIDFDELDFGELYFDQSKTVALSVTNPYAIDGETAIYASVYPGKFAQGTRLTISGETTSHSFSRTFDLANDIVFEAGKIATLNVSLRAQDCEEKERGLALPITDDFSWQNKSTTDDLTTTNKNRNYTILDKCDYLASAKLVYEGGVGILRLGSSNTASQLVTKNLDLSGTFKVVLNAKRYAQATDVAIKVSAGTQSVTKNLTTEYADYTFNFTSVGTSAAVTIETISVNSGAPRAYLNGLSIESDLPSVLSDGETLSMSATPDGVNKQISVQWSKLALAQNYHIEKVSGPASIDAVDYSATEAETAEYTHVFNVSEYGDYVFKVTASADNYSSAEASSEATHLVQPQLAAPTLASVTEADVDAENKTVILRWSEVDENATKVEIYKGSTRVATVDKTPAAYTASFDNYDTEYTFSVKASAPGTNYKTSTSSNTVTVGPISDPTAKAFSVSPLSFNDVSYEGGKKLITITADEEVEWSMENVSEGLTFEVVSGTSAEAEDNVCMGSGNATVNVVIASNTKITAANLSFDVTTTNEHVGTDSYKVNIAQQAWPSYKLTINNPNGAEIFAYVNNEEVHSGDMIAKDATVSLMIDYGQNTFNNWIINGDTSVTSEETEFTMTAATTVSADVTVSSSVVPGTYNITPANAFWGTSYNGTATGATSLSGTSNNISITLNKNSSGSAMYVNNSQTRVYSGYSMTFSVPDGYQITSIVFTADGTNWTGTHTADSGTMTDNKHWSGKKQAVTITFAGTCRMTGVAVTFAAASSGGETVDVPYEIVFKTASSDGGNTIGSSTTVSNVVDEGDEFVASFTSNCSKAYYVGINGVKLGSSSAAGTLEFNLANSVKYNVVSVEVQTAKYGSDTGTITMYSGTTSLQSGITPGNSYKHSFGSPTTVESLKFTTSSKRAYIKKVIITVREEQ